MIYQITLFNRTHMCDMVTFNYPILPEIGETIEISKGHYFIIENRTFSSWVDNEKATLTLYGALKNLNSYNEFRFSELLKHLSSEAGSQYLNLID